MGRRRTVIAALAGAAAARLAVRALSADAKPRPTAQAGGEYAGGADSAAWAGGADSAAHVRGADNAARAGGADSAAHVGGADNAARAGGADSAAHVGGADNAAHVGGADNAARADGADSAARVGGRHAAAHARGGAATRLRASLQRTNFRGREVSLAGGLAYAAGAGGVAALSGGPVGVAAAVAGLGAGAVGAYDDAVGGRPGHAGAKGFRGHLTALQQGRVTSGMVKIVGIGVAGMAAAGHLDFHAGRWARTGKVAGAADAVLAGAVIAASANLVNLFDLRPGRALKVGLAAAVPLAAAGGPGAPVAAAAAGAAAALLPEDLGERTMLGDAGANALGALLGTAVAARTGRRGRLALLAGLVALTAASEKVSFTRVIESTPVLRELDSLGRVPR